VNRCSGTPQAPPAIRPLVQRLTPAAPYRETQANPLPDNYEGMTIAGGPGLAASLISDDNLSATRFTAS
jgi:hypothetical protein